MKSRDGLAVVGGILIAAAYIGLTGFHLYTAWLSNKEFGAFWGIIVFLTPPLSDLYWIGHMISRDGFISFYTECLAALIAAYGLGFAAMQAGGANTTDL